MQSDINSCLIAFSGGVNMSLKTVFVRIMIVFVLTDHICMPRMLQGFAGMCRVRPKATWVAAICPGDLITLTMPHGSGPSNQQLIWFPFGKIGSVSSMIVSVTPVEQITHHAGRSSSQCRVGLSIPQWSLKPHRVFTLTSTTLLILWFTQSPQMVKLCDCNNYLYASKSAFAVLSKGLNELCK